MEGGQEFREPAGKSASYRPPGGTAEPPVTPPAMTNYATVSRQATGSPTRGGPRLPQAQREAECRRSAGQLGLDAELRVLLRGDGKSTLVGRLAPLMAQDTGFLSHWSRPALPTFITEHPAGLVHGTQDGRGPHCAC